MLRIQISTQMPTINQRWPLRSLLLRGSVGSVPEKKLWSISKVLWQYSYHIFHDSFLSTFLLWLICCMAWLFTDVSEFHEIIGKELAAEFAQANNVDESQKSLQKCFTALMTCQPSVLEAKLQSLVTKIENLSESYLSLYGFSPLEYSSNIHTIICPYLTIPMLILCCIDSIKSYRVKIPLCWMVNCCYAWTASSLGMVDVSVSTFSIE